MSDPEIIKKKVRLIILKTFSLSENTLPKEVKMDSLPQWDSLGHMQLIVELENAFSVRFPGYSISEMVSEAKIVNQLKELNV